MIGNLDLITSVVINKLSPTPIASSHTLFSSETKKEVESKSSISKHFVDTGKSITPKSALEAELEQEIRKQIKFPTSSDYQVTVNFDSNRNSYIVTILGPKEQRDVIFNSLIRLNHAKNLDAILGKKQEENFISVPLTSILDLCENLSDPARAQLMELLPSSFLFTDWKKPNHV